jgi:hypothetical protein
VSGGHGRVDAVAHGELRAPAQHRGRAGGDPDAGGTNSHRGRSFRWAVLTVPGGPRESCHRPSATIPDER